MLHREGDVLKWRIRDDADEESEDIARLLDAAFSGHPHSRGAEAAIVSALRKDRTLSASFVAESNGEIIGYAAASPVAISNRTGWFGLGPVAVLPARQNSGFGHALVSAVLARLRASSGAEGCVVVGDPEYYARFGFAAIAGLTVDGVPPQYVLAQAFGTADSPSGLVVYHAAFGAEP